MTDLSRRGLLGSAAAAAAFLAPPAAAQAPASAATVLLTAHVATFALATALTKGSALTVEAVQPPKLPASRLASFLSGRGKERLAELSAQATAVVTIRSFWSEDPLYPHARRGNIRIIEIDGGRPLDGALPGIAIAAPTDDTAIHAALDLQPMPASGEASAPWLAPSGMAGMADVLAADLSRLDPGSADAIAANLAGLKHRLLAAKAEADAGLAQAENLTALSLSPHFSYLAADLGIDLLGSITAAASEWTGERCENLAAWLEDEAVAVVMLDAEPSEVLAGAIESGGARAVVIGQVGAETNDPVTLVEANLGKLAEAFRD